jgi:hypothetical protein
MAIVRLGRIALLAFIIAWLPARSFAKTPEAAHLALHVKVVLVGAAGADATLFGRIRSLFDAHAQLEVQHVERVASTAVLNPDRFGVVYLWVTLGSDNVARVYVATREDQGKTPRYLFRDIRLETGLDEIGAETLAQVAHSSVAALGASDQETSKEDLVALLAREAERGQRDAETTEGRRSLEQRTAVHQASAPAQPTTPAAMGERRASRTPALAAESRRPWALSLGPQYAIRHAGGEGWLQYPTTFFALSFRHAASLRMAAAYLLPTHFDVSSTHVRLSGYAGDIRLAWNIGKETEPSLRLEGGFGWLSMRWNAESSASGAGYPAGNDSRPFAVVAVAGQWPLGPLRIGVRLELIAPTRQTSYDIAYPDRTVVVAESWLAMGGAVELELPLARF